MNMNEWSKEIRIRRMKWLGHLLRLNENSPAAIALKETNERFHINVNHRSKNESR